MTISVMRNVAMSTFRNVNGNPPIKFSDSNVLKIVDKTLQALAPHLGGDEDDLFKTLTVSIFCPDWSIDTKCCE